MGSTSGDSPLARSQTTRKQFPGSFGASQGDHSGLSTAISALQGQPAVPVQLSKMRTSLLGTPDAKLP